jgi:hypothetical protein
VLLAQSGPQVQRGVIAPDNPQRVHTGLHRDKVQRHIRRATGPLLRRSHRKHRNGRIVAQSIDVTEDQFVEHEVADDNGSKRLPVRQAFKKCGHPPTLAPPPDPPAAAALADIRPTPADEHRRPEHQKEHPRRFHAKRRGW